MVEFFIEGTRSRSGLTLNPKLGMLKMCTDLYFDGQINNMSIIPISISYDRVLEGETFPFELLGEEKVKESLTRIFNSVKMLRMNFGKIHVNFSNLINFKEFAKSHSNLNPVASLKDRETITRNLGYRVALDI